jgi:type VI protein secretion system component Hcp
VSSKDISVNKRIDDATPRLMLSSASGQHLKSAGRTVRAAGHKQPELLKIKMEACSSLRSRPAGRAPRMTTLSVGREDDGGRDRAREPAGRQDPRGSVF